jgi:transposase
MARYKRIDIGLKLLPVDLSCQLIPGTFEFALHHLLDHELDLRGLDERFRNDQSGAPAYAPSVLLRVILFFYSRGIVSSRAIEQVCRENIVFMALSGDSIPHFTTVASFVRELKDEIANVFTQILFLCDAQGLIGREMFAIDGVKLPCNASKAKNGTLTEFKRQADKIEVQVKKMLDRHREADDQPLEAGFADKQTQRIERLQQDAAQLRHWLKDNPEDRRGAKKRKGDKREKNRENRKGESRKGNRFIYRTTHVAPVASSAVCRAIDVRPSCRVSIRPAPQSDQNR